MSLNPFINSHTTPLTGWKLRRGNYGFYTSQPGATEPSGNPLEST